MQSGRFWSTLTSAIHDWNDADTVFNDYNNHRPHSPLKSLIGIDVTPKEAWDSFLTKELMRAN